MNDKSNRLASLDQFRGYTVLGMFLVNFWGGFHVVPGVLQHHHTFCSYADTIMPQFLFAVGFAMRLSFLKRVEKQGLQEAYRHFAYRSLSLILLGIVVYHLTGKYESWEVMLETKWSHFLLYTFKRTPFETLVHIGVTSIWVLPVIRCRMMTRALFAVGCAGLHVLLSLMFYYSWNMQSPAGVDGGPLGFLTWTMPLIAGSLVQELAEKKTSAAKIAASSLPFMLLGILLSKINPTTTFPFVMPNEDELVFDYWVMSQRAGSVTYLLFATGFSILVFALFQVLCDSFGIAWGLFDMLGRNALLAYIVHDMVAESVKPFCPKDSPAWWVLIAVTIYLTVTLSFMKYLDNRKLWLKL